MITDTGRELSAELADNSHAQMLIHVRISFEFSISSPSFFPSLPPSLPLCLHLFFLSRNTAWWVSREQLDEIKMDILFMPTLTLTLL